MSPNHKNVQLTALLGFFAVALGAFGAHGLDETLRQHDTIETWKTASHYHLAHAIVLLVLSMMGSGGRKVNEAAWQCFFFGIVIFSGSLYVLSVTGMKWLGAITPIGGLLLMAGWLLTALGRWGKGQSGQ